MKLEVIMPQASLVSLQTTMNIRTAITTIHRDRLWWRTALIGGALTLTIVGYPWVAGLVTISYENSRHGYPTPLPPWNDWGNRYLIGLLSSLIDILFFLVPIFVTGIVFACGGGALAILHIEWLPWIAPILLILLGVYELTMFATGVAPIGHTMFATTGQLEEVLSTKPLRHALQPAYRGIYIRTRLQSLPAYLPTLLLFSVAWLASWPINVALLWLALSALVYAQLVVVQLYVSAERMLN